MAAKKKTTKKKRAPRKAPAKKRAPAKKKAAKKKTTSSSNKPLEVEVRVKKGSRTLATMTRRAPSTATQWNAWLKKCKAAKNCAANVLDGERELSRIK